MWKEIFSKRQHAAAFEHSHFDRFSAWASATQKR
ncbi:hypothetical protein PhCBS80983_g01609 [Powellomyces hirtus]|uniref:Uncharacterized protein n=1 Tax=Powellomyces hirtus TaxID=109895 RepID=A0A507EA72_9FUNG|nr:hypothetical protein PhCBS80983_g01609 [Powellomyces hirtus]